MLTVKSDAPAETSVLLEPNRSLSPENHSFIVAGAVLVFIAMSLAFLILGAWLVIPFVLLEMMVLIAALGWVQARCTVKESLSINPDCVVVHKEDAGHCWDWSFERENLSLIVSRDALDCIQHVTICGTSGLVEIGDFLTDDELQKLISSLRKSGLFSRNSKLNGCMTC